MSAFQVTGFRQLTLPDDPEGYVGHVWIFYNPGPLQLDVLSPEMVEHPHPLPEKHGDQVHMYLSLIHISEPTRPY